jgi:ribokinase
MAIWNLGSINIDQVYRLDSLPKPGETLTSRSHSFGLGGKGANQSVAAAQAGATTHHLGAMGTGDDWVVTRLAEKGVDTSHIARLADQTTGHAIIMVDQEAENAIVIHAGANRAINEAALTATLDQITASDTLLIQNEANGQVAAAKAAQAKGARVIYSAAPFDLEAVREILPHVSILAMNEGEAAQLFAALSGDLTVQGLLITRGSQGAEYYDLTDNQTYKQMSFKVTPVDTTGAGDTFAGYFAAGLDAGMPIPDALRRASAAAALQVTREGAGDAIPASSEVDVFLADQS